MGTETTANGSATGSASAFITFSAPLVDESIGARIRASEAQRDAQDASVAQLLLSVRTSAVQAAVSVRNARAALAQGEELARQAEANLAQARGRYEAGAASYLELVDAEAADAGARITVVRLRAATDLAKLQLLAATGRLDRGPR
jgi:outer membrane protein TolC